MPKDLSEEQWDQLAELEKILNPIHKATTLLQHQYIPTIGTIFPIIKNILHHLDTTAASIAREEAQRAQNIPPPPPSSLDLFKVAAGDHINDKFNDLMGNWGKELTLSVFLDPRVKDFFFVEDKERQQ